MDIKHRMIVFDAADIEAESAFWAGLLDGEPQQIHLDLYFEGVAAHTAAHERALALGARLLKPAEDSAAPRGVQVYADPAGHPFCLCWVPA